MRTRQYAFPFVSKHRGIVLISVLWLLLLLSAIVLTLVREGRLATRSAAVYIAEMQTKAEIQGAVYEGIYRLTSGETFSAVVAALQSQDFVVNIANERLKLDLNNASVEELAGYFVSHELDSATKLALRVVDFRDKDDDAGEGGSERRLYQRAGLVNPPGNRPYVHVYELSRVPGFAGLLNGEILSGLTVMNNTNISSPVTIDISKTSKLVRQRARVTVRLAGTKERPFRVLRWDWASR